jgi:hypothetical protein
LGAEFQGRVSTKVYKAELKRDLLCIKRQVRTDDECTQVLSAFGPGIEPTDADIENEASSIVFSNFHTAPGYATSEDFATASLPFQTSERRTQIFSWLIASNAKMAADRQRRVVAQGAEGAAVAAQPTSAPTEPAPNQVRRQYTIDRSVCRYRCVSGIFYWKWQPTDDLNCEPYHCYAPKNDEDQPCDELHKGQDGYGHCSEEKEHVR